MQILLKSATDRALLGVLALTITLIFALTTGAAAKTLRQLADSMETKIAAVRDNGAKDRPGRKITVFQQDEINAYFAERRLTMPDGVRSVKFALSPNQVRAQARIDFDDITRNRRSQNPLMYLFTGTHDVEVNARATAAGPGMVKVSVQSVTINGVTVPRMALEFFIDRYVSPKYPQVGLDQDYRLPAKMDSVIIGPRQGTVTQK